MESSPDTSYKLVEIPGRDSALVAARDLPRGTTIFASRPEVAVLYSDFAATHCAGCYRDVGSVGGSSAHRDDQAPQLAWACGGCASFVLCGSCDAEVLRAWHVDGECAAFQKVPAHLRKGDSDYLRWFLRYFDLRRRGPPPPPGAAPRDDVAGDGGGGGVEGEAVKTSNVGGSRDLDAAAANRVCPFTGLVDLEAIQTESFREWAKGFAKLFASHCAPLPLGVGEGEVYGLLLRQRVNALGFPFSSDATLGWCLHAAASRLNHSCSPNCFIMDPSAAVAERNSASSTSSSSTSFSSSPSEQEAAAAATLEAESAGKAPKVPVGRLAVVTTRPVAAGEELTISYLDLTDSAAHGTAKRRTAVLREKYLFDCACERCCSDHDDEGDAATSSAAATAAAAAAAPVAATAAPLPTPPKRISITVPEGAKPGDQLSVDVAGSDGVKRALRVAIPGGAVPGTTLVVTF